MYIYIINKNQIPVKAWYSIPRGKYVLKCYQLQNNVQSNIRPPQQASSCK